MLSDSAVVVERNKKKYALVGLCVFNDISSEILESNFGLIDIHKSRTVYEITDEKKYMLAKIKYGI